MDATLPEDLRLALELADIADVITMARYRAADLDVVLKDDMTPVSESDKRVEIALRRRLAHLRPHDAILGEEFGSSEAWLDAGGPLATGAAQPGRRAWIIDPIDGTMSYVRGMDTWSTLIALASGGDVQVGVVSMPALGKRWWATRGGGALADGRRIQVSRVSELGDAQLVWSGIEAWDAVGGAQALLKLARACWRTRGIGDAWQYMMVAQGAAEIAVDPEVTLWDLAAVSIVVQEAGGRLTNLAGVPGPGGGSGLASNGLLHDAALALLDAGAPAP
ncbi:MAG: inositol monophosphatase family protein [Solirubrobacteraceae bacterium]